MKISLLLSLLVIRAHLFVNIYSNTRITLIAVPDLIEMISSNP
jgi:hypothetical protein